MKNTRKTIRSLLLIVFVVSTVLLLRQQWDNQGGTQAQADALHLASQPKQQVQTLPPETTQPPIVYEWIPAPVEEADPVMEEMAQINLEALREVNPDVLGWIRIPDTKIDYPFLQGEDNDYYLKHTWQGKKNAVGSIFLEHLSSPDMTDYHTIVYGHNMLNGSMFAGLTRFSSEKYWEEHPYVYILTEEGVWRYEIFSSYKAAIDSLTYAIGFDNPNTKGNFLRHALQSSKYDTGIVPEETDRILTLSTCSGGKSTRWVMHCRLKMIQVEAA